MSVPQGFLSAEELASAVSEGREMASRVCGSCRWRRGTSDGFERCQATAFYCNIAWSSPNLCARGRLWEPKPPRQLGIFERAWRFLFGGRA